jgi:riboflavin kinase / FMN adenylyltransferase
MKIFRNKPPLEMRHARVVTIGNFDGIHRGHQVVLANLKSVSSKLGLPCAVLTFDPHPREFFANLATRQDPDNQVKLQAPARIHALRDKACALEALGVDELIVAHFNPRLAAMPAVDFVNHYLVNELHIKHLYVGDDFHFGARRQGNFDLLKTMADQCGFTVEATPSVMLACGASGQMQRVSSSLVRQALASADFTSANSLLNRPYALTGRVIHGRKLGRTLGFPTLNLVVPGSTVGGTKPLLHGVFAVRVHNLKSNNHHSAGPENPKIYNGVASLGTRPAVEQNGRYLLETHVFDYAANAYGQTVSIEFVSKLRDEANYDSLDALTHQIGLDAANAKAVLAQKHLPF